MNVYIPHNEATFSQQNRCSDLVGNIQRLELISS
jgi:hypothetical protein